MKRTDFIDPDRGLLATLEDRIPLAVFQREPESEGASLELTLRPEQPRIVLDGDLLGRWEINSARMEGTLVTQQGETSVAGFGSTTTGSLNAEAEPDDAQDPAALRRLISISFEDGGLLALVAASERGSESHSDEKLLAATCEADGTFREFSLPLLSTEYGADGMQRRATLELWGQDGGVVRGGGSVLAGVELELPGARSSTAFFEWSVEGRIGVGRYEIIRAS